jgi:hypothetical protein
MSRSRNILALLLCFIATAHGAADAALGGEVGFTLGSMIDAAAPLASTLDDTFALFPTLHVEDPLWRLDAKASLSWKWGARDVTQILERLSLELTPADFLTVRIGRFAYLPGAGGVGSCTNWFSSLDLEALLEGDAADIFTAGDLIQGTIAVGDFSFTFTASPFPPALNVPDPASSWFPKKNFPQTLHISFPTPQDISLTDIIVETPTQQAMSLSGMSFGAELSASFPLLDMSLLAYHGSDNTALFQPRFSFPNGFFSDYRIILTPVARTIDAFGLDASFGWSSFNAWIDCGYTMSKTFLSKKLSAAAYSSELTTSPYLQYAVGCGYEMASPHLSLQAGCRGGWISQETSDTILPFLDSYVSARGQLQLWEDRVSLSAQTLSSTVDWSTVVIGVLSFAPSTEFSVDLIFPVFFGGSDTELGQFSGNHLISIGATVRF